MQPRGPIVALVLGLVLGVVPAGLSTPSAAAEAESAPPQRFVCRGEEPFWRLDLGLASARLTRPGDTGAHEESLAGELVRMDALDPEWAVWRGARVQAPDETEGSSPPLVATLRREECRSTMADTPPSPWRVVVSFASGDVATGCCETEPAADLRKPSPPDAVSAPLAPR